MTEKEYLEQKEQLDNFYQKINEELDNLGFGIYNDGSGDYGERRLIKNNIVICIIIINDMVADYFGDYPDFIFYDKTNDIVIKSLEDLKHLK